MFYPSRFKEKKAPDLGSATLGFTNIQLVSFLICRVAAVRIRIVFVGSWIRIKVKAGYGSALK
jgi:hypothetical protein